MGEGNFCGLLSDIRLQKLLFQLLEYGCLRIAEIWLDVIFGVEEDLAVCLPHAVVLNPLPLFNRDRRRIDSSFQVHQTPLYVELQACGPLHDPGGIYFAAYLQVEEEVLMEDVGIFPTFVLRIQLQLRHGKTKQSIPPLNRQLVMNWLVHLWPFFVSIFGTQNLQQQSCLVGVEAKLLVRPKQGRICKLDHKVDVHLQGLGQVKARLHAAQT